MIQIFSTTNLGAPAGNSSNNGDGVTIVNTFNVKEISSDEITITGENGISFMFDAATNKVTNIIFAVSFSPFLFNIKEQLELKEFHFVLYNITQTKTLIAKIIALDSSSESDSYFIASVAPIIKVEDIAVLNEVAVTISAASINVPFSKPILSFQDFWYNGINSSGWMFRQHTNSAQVVNTGIEDLVTALGAGSSYLHKPLFVAPFPVKLINIVINIENAWSLSIGPIGFGKHLKLNGTNSVSNAVSIHEFSDSKGGYRRYYKSLTPSEFGNVIIDEGESFFIALKGSTRGINTTVIVEKI